MKSPSDALKTSEQFNKVEPLQRGAFPIAELELDPRYGLNCGRLWLDHNWFTVAEARELRDWLNKVIP